MARIKIEDLPRPAEALTSEQAKAVRGGRIMWEQREAMQAKQRASVSEFSVQLPPRLPLLFTDMTIDLQGNVFNSEGMCLGPLNQVSTPSEEKIHLDFDLRY